MASSKLGRGFFLFVGRIGPDMFARVFWLAIILSIIAIISYCEYASHSRLMENYAQTTAYFDREYNQVTTQGGYKKYKITYWFDVNGKHYRGEAESPLNPK